MLEYAKFLFMKNKTKVSFCTMPRYAKKKFFKRTWSYAKKNFSFFYHAKCCKLGIP